MVLARTVVVSRHVAALLGITLLVVALRASYFMHISPYGLAPDEAQYWHWLQHNALAFTTKPGLTTWLLGLSTSLFGHGVLGVKAFALLGQAALPLVGAALVHRAGGGWGAAWLAFAGLTTAPLVAAGGLIMAPDALLTPLWLAALYVLLGRAGGPTLGLRAAVLIGVLVGLGGLAKYSAAVFFPLVFVWACFEKPQWLRQPHLYAAGLVALALQAPTLVWNIHNDFAGLHHLLWQADGGGDARHGGLSTLLEFIGAQAGVLGLLGLGLALFGWGAVVFTYARTTPAARLLWWFSFPLFGAFLVQTTGAKVQPNWPILATIPGIILGVLLLAPHLHKRTVQAAVGVGLALAAGLSVALHNTHWLRDAGVPLRLKIDPTKDLLGWPEQGAIIGQLLATLQPHTVLVADRYQTVAQLAYHVPQARAYVAARGQNWGEGGVPVVYLDTGTRRDNEYTRWPWPALHTPTYRALGVFISNQPGLPAALGQHFATCQPWQKVQVASHGYPVRLVHVHLCW